MSVCLSWLKYFRFLSSNNPVFKAVTFGFISWKGEVISTSSCKKDLETAHVTSHIHAASQSKEAVFAFRSQCTNNQRSQRTHGVRTNAGTSAENKSYGNVANFWATAIMSTWNSAQGRFDYNPCGLKGISLALRIFSKRNISYQMHA